MQDEHRVPEWDFETGELILGSEAGQPTYFKYCDCPNNCGRPRVYYDPDFQEECRPQTLYLTKIGILPALGQHGWYHGRETFVGPCACNQPLCLCYGVYYDEQGYELCPEQTLMLDHECEIGTVMSVAAGGGMKEITVSHFAPLFGKEIIELLRPLPRHAFEDGTALDMMYEFIVQALKGSDKTDSSKASVVEYQKQRAQLVQGAIKN